MTDPASPRSLRRAYLDWVEEQVESFKDTIPRADLLRLADEVVDDLRVNRNGQYQLTELLMCAAMDRRIARILKLPGYRAWCAERQTRLRVQVLTLAPAPPKEPPVPEVVEEMESVA